MEEILNILGIKIIENRKFVAIINNIKTSTKLDFIIEPSKTSKNEFGDIKNIFLESKFKQIAGSDWEKNWIKFWLSSIFL